MDPGDKNLHYWWV